MATYLNSVNTYVYSQRLTSYCSRKLIGEKYTPYVLPEDVLKSLNDFLAKYINIPTSFISIRSEISDYVVLAMTYYVIHNYPKKSGGNAISPRKPIVPNSSTRKKLEEDFKSHIYQICKHYPYINKIAYDITKHRTFQPDPKHTEFSFDTDIEPILKNERTPNLNPPPAKISNETIKLFNEVGLGSTVKTFAEKIIPDPEIKPIHAEEPEESELDEYELALREKEYSLMKAGIMRYITDPNHRNPADRTALVNYVQICSGCNRILKDPDLRSKIDKYIKDDVNLRTNRVAVIDYFKPSGKLDRLYESIIKVSGYVNASHYDGIDWNYILGKQVLPERETIILKYQLQLGSLYEQFMRLAVPLYEFSDESMEMIEMLQDKLESNMMLKSDADVEPSSGTDSDLDSDHLQLPGPSATQPHSLGLFESPDVGRLIYEAENKLTELSEINEQIEEIERSHLGELHSMTRSDSEAELQSKSLPEQMRDSSTISKEDVEKSIIAKLERDIELLQLQKDALEEKQQVYSSQINDLERKYDNATNKYLRYETQLSNIRKMLGETVDENTLRVCESDDLCQIIKTLKDKKALCDVIQNTASYLSPEHTNTDTRKSTQTSSFTKHSKYEPECLEIKTVSTKSGERWRMVYNDNGVPKLKVLSKLSAQRYIDQGCKSAYTVIPENKKAGTVKTRKTTRSKRTRRKIR